MLSTSTDLGAVGEQHVTAILSALGYSCRLQTERHRSASIMATGPANLLVQVKTSLYPSLPADLTCDELRDIAARAARIGCQAWFAKLRINSIGAPVGEVIWGRVAN